MIGTLKRASAEAIDAKLYGFVTVEVDDAERTYCYTFPSAEDEGHGYAVIERLSGISAAQIKDGWNADQTSNYVAVQTMAAINHMYKEQRIVLGQEHPSVGRSTWIDLRPLPIEVPPSLSVDSIDELLPEPVKDWTNIDQIYVERGATTLDPSTLVVTFADAGPVRFQVPGPADQNPTDWWFVEVYTGIAHERIVTGWKKKDNSNPVLDDTVNLLYRILIEYQVPHDAGIVDIEYWRRVTVRARWQRGALPFLFPNRPTYDIDRTRKLLDDICGGTLFVFDAEPGLRRGRPAQVQTIRKRPALIMLDNARLAKQVLSNYINYAKSGHPPKYIYPPDEVVDSFIYLPSPKLPRIKGLTRIPVMRPDGTVLDKHGYDVSSQLWYAPEVEIEALPEQVTEDDIAAARAWVLTPFSEFPFVAEGDRTAVIAALLEQIVRPMIFGPRPLYIFDAAGPGSGKTLCAQILQVILTGRDPVISAMGHREEEIEKRITSYLRDGSPLVILDNLTADLKSQALQQLATSQFWQARLLGGHEAPSIPQISTWVLTLNNARVNHDMSRRTILSRMDAKMDKAWLRTGFRIKNVINWAREHRTEIIRSLLILARAWVQAGRPADPDIRTGSFEAWASVVGGILKHTGFPGLAKAAEIAAAERGIDHEDHLWLVKGWLENGGQPLAAINLADLAIHLGLYTSYLEKAKQPIAKGRAMTRVLKDILGRPLGGYTVRRSPTLSSGYIQYTLEPLL